MLVAQMHLLHLLCSWEMIFVQSICENFLTIFSLILTLYVYSLSSLFSLHCFWPMKRERKEVVTKVVGNSCSNITPLCSWWLSSVNWVSKLLCCEKWVGIGHITSKFTLISNSCYGKCDMTLFHSSLFYCLETLSHLTNVLYVI